MNLLILDDIGYCLDLALHAQEYGHNVKVFIWPNDDRTRSEVGDGLIDRVENWQRLARNWADLIFLTDNTHFLRDLAPIREKVRVFGATWQSAQLELDRQKGQDMFAKCGIPTIPSETFTDYNKAIEYVKKKGVRMVSKPSGDADKALSYVSKSPADMVYMLERWRDLKKIKSPFILQEFKKGVEIAVGGWIGPQGFIRGKWYENFEVKKMMNGDLGVNTGQMCEVSKYAEESLLAEKLLLPLEQEIIKTGHIGYFDMAAIMDEDGEVWPLEATSRPGWPPFHLQSYLHQGDPVQWMFDLCDGRDTLEVNRNICAGVVMAIPDFPYSKITRKQLQGYPLYHLDDVDSEQIRLVECKKGVAPYMDGDKVVNKEGIVSAGDYILVSCGAGQTIRQAAKKAYEPLEVIEMPNSPFWRTDCGVKQAKELPELQSHGYCLEWENE